MRKGPKQLNSRRKLKARTTAPALVVPRAIQNLIVVSDLHAGCRMGLVSDGGAILHDGGRYLPSKLQQVVWNWWTEFWEEWVPQATHHEPYCVIVNGDVVDGVHHHSTTQISHDLEDQAEIAYSILSPIVAKCDGRLYMVKGTPAHTGQSGIEEERLAKRLQAVPGKDGQRARYELWKKVGDDGLVHFNHHIGTTSSSAHETSAINAELASAFVEAGRWGAEPPDIICRSHRHRCAEVRIPSKKGYAIAFVTAAWQLKTPFLFKVAGGRMTTPQIGGHLIRVAHGELFTRHWVRDIGRTPAE